MPSGVIDQIHANLSILLLEELGRKKAGGRRQKWITSHLSPLTSAFLLLQSRYSSRTSANFCTANSRSVFVCAAETCVRIRAIPFGTTG